MRSDQSPGWPAEARSTDVNRASLPAGPDDRLNSWKEIAAYLGREVRTVQRWEKQESLPVRRHQHDRSGTVYAYRSELDAWLAGRRPEPDGAPAGATARVASGHWLRATAAVLGVVVIVLAVLAWWRVARSPGPAERVRLAVLPFENLGADPDHEFFADGLTEETIHQLGRLDPRHLAVIGRSSVARYRSGREDLERVGRELGVDYVLEGSVRRDPQRVRIAVQLRHVRDLAVLWSDSYDRSLSEVLTVQADVAAQVSRALGRRLGADSRVLAPARLTEHPEAQDAYLRGRYLWNRGTARGFVESLRSFERALQFDGGFARAHAGLAAAHLMLGRYGLRPPGQAFPPAKAAALEALKLNNDLAEAHATLAGVLFYWEWDFEAAEAAFRRALTLDATSARGHHGLAHFLSVMGRHAEAIAAARRAQELEPLSAMINSDAAWFYYRARRYDEAQAECRRVLELEPAFTSAQICVVHVFEKKGLHEQARGELRRQAQTAGQRELVDLLEGPDPLGALHRYRRWRLDGLVAARSAGHYVSPYPFAVLHAALGETDAAFRYLDEALEARDRAVLMLKVHPGFDPLRGDPRLGELIEKVGLRRYTWSSRW